MMIPMTGVKFQLFSRNSYSAMELLHALFLSEHFADIDARVSKMVLDGSVFSSFIHRIVRAKKKQIHPIALLMMLYTVEKRY